MGNLITVGFSVVFILGFIAAPLMVLWFLISLILYLLPAKTGYVKESRKNRLKLAAILAGIGLVFLILALVLMALISQGETGTLIPGG